MDRQLENWKIALDKSSSTNRMLSVLIFSIFLYIFIVTGTTTDLKLLLPGSSVTLPLLNVEVPLMGFFILAPLAVVLLHFNMLFQLYKHSQKLYQWQAFLDKNNIDDGEELLFPYIFNFTIESGKDDLRVLRFFIHLTLFIFPLALLVFIQYRFSDYHSVWMTSWHVLLVMVDTIMLGIYQPRVGVDRRKTNHIVKHIIRAAIILAFFIIVSMNLGLSWGILLLVVLFVQWFWGLVLKGMLVSVSITNFIIILLLTQNFISPIRFQIEKDWIPHLDVRGEVIVRTKPNEVLVAKYAEMGKPQEDVWIDYAEGLDLSHRDLRYANFHKARIPKINLEGASLQGANFGDARAEKAYMSTAQLEGAYMSLVHLDGADLSNAILDGADLSYAELHGANLWGAQLQGASLSLAQMQGAELGEAQLQGADMWYAQLQGATLWSAQMQGADLRSAQLQGAELWFTELQGADLRTAQFQGAHLRSVLLQGADLRSTQLKGSYLQLISSRGVDMSYADTDSLFISNSDWKTAQDFDSLTTKILPKLPMDETDNFKVKMIEASARQNKGITTNIQSDIAGFVEIRKSLICDESYPIKHLLIGYLLMGHPNEQEAQINRELIDYAIQYCPQRLEGIDINWYRTAR